MEIWAPRQTRQGWHKWWYKVQEKNLVDGKEGGNASEVVFRARGATIDKRTETNRAQRAGSTHGREQKQVELGAEE